MNSISSNQQTLYWFLLGREPLLSLAELTSVLYLSPSSAQEGFCPPFLIAPAEVDATELIRHLGGTIKIGVELGRNLSESELLDTMTAELKNVEGKINFGISMYGQEGGANTEKIKHWGQKIKNILKELGRSVRHVFNYETALSSVSVSKNGLDKRGREFLITILPLSPSPLSGRGGHPPLLAKEWRGVVYALAKTLAVQPFENFSARDFGRPGRDDASGMLPPKLAMMMINISGAQKNGVLLDPFCGSGTILTEAILLGHHNLIGADLSEKAVDDTKKNIEWIKNKLVTDDKQLAIEILQNDVKDISKAFPLASVDAIVTEPFLGPPLRGNETELALKKTCQELSNLYQNAFIQFKKILKPQGIVVFTIPRYKIKNTWYTISDKTVPEIIKIGFKSERLLPQAINREPFVLYHRPAQFVGREIWKFRL